MLNTFKKKKKQVTMKKISKRALNAIDPRILSNMQKKKRPFFKGKWKIVKRRQTHKYNLIPIIDKDWHIFKLYTCNNQSKGLKI